jgi:predicted AAA+ superfamily ATPase
MTSLVFMCMCGYSYVTRMKAYVNGKWTEWGSQKTYTYEMRCTLGKQQAEDARRKNCEKQERRRKIDARINGMIGMIRVKNLFDNWRTAILQHEKDNDNKSAYPRGVSRLNVRLTGSPGTGKTTIAKLLGEFFYEYGILQSSNSVQCMGAILQQKVVGEGSENIHNLFKKAKGGVILIDEVSGGLDESNRNANIIKTLLGCIDENPDTLVIVADYAGNILFILLPFDIIL